MKQVIVRPAAAAAIDDAYQWYEAQRPGLGEEFLMALNATGLARIRSPRLLTATVRPLNCPLRTNGAVPTV